jgi:hypothetical protein
LRLTSPQAHRPTYPIGDASNYTAFDHDQVLQRSTNRRRDEWTGTWRVVAAQRTNYVNRYFTLGAAGDNITATSDVTMNWVAADVQGGANYQNFMVGLYQGTNGWVSLPTIASAAVDSIPRASQQRRCLRRRIW